MTIQLDTRVNEVLLRCPAAGVVLHRWGLDTCCGGNCTIAEAAHHLGRSPETLLQELLTARPMGTT